jgi:hypothetical protein
VSVAGFSLDEAVVESGPVDSSAFEFRQLSGIMGFAWGTISESQLQTFMEQLVGTDTLAENVVSFHLGRGADTVSPNADRSSNSTVTTGSSLTIGGTDKSTVSDAYELCCPCHSLSY